jgi:hypothetical protein
MVEVKKRTALKTTKNVAKNSGELGGAAVAIILTKVAQSYGIPIGVTEATILGGFLVGIGSNIRHLIKDD